jgi:FixJ family two-component response regulator
MDRQCARTVGLSDSGGGKRKRRVGSAIDLKRETESIQIYAVHPLDTRKMSWEGSTVYIVDDDHRIREALHDLLASLGLQAVSFESAAEYIAFPKPDRPACLLLDIELPDVNGLEFQRQLADVTHPPIIFITGHGDIPSSVRAIRAGAIDFLTKPFSEAALIDAIDRAIAQDRVARLESAEVMELQRRLASLTPREHEVLPLVASGLLNKQAAAELGISEITLQIHRSKIMQKMQASSLAELVRMAGRLGIPMTRSRRVHR